MELLKTSFISALGVLVRLFAQLGINKILAFYLGPAGFALIGQYQNLMQMMMVFSTNTLNNGIVKKTAENGKSDAESQATINVWRSSVTYSIVCTLFVVAVAIIYGDLIAGKYMGSEEYSSVPLYFAAAFLFFCFNNILISILNGFGEVKLMMLSNVIGSMIAITFTYAFVVRLGVLGALIALSVYQGVWFFATLFISRRFVWLKLENFFGRSDFASFKFLSKFVVMSLITALCVPLSQIYVRGVIISEISMESAGYWEGMQRLSLAYLSVATTVLSIYFLPKYSIISTKNELKKEILNGYLFVAPVLMVILVSVYILREHIILIVYSEEFVVISTLIHYQLVGDFLKICSWILSYYLVAKAMTKMFVILEVLFTFGYMLFTWVSISYFGFDYVALGYAINYLLYFSVLLFLCFRRRGYINSVE